MPAALRASRGSCANQRADSRGSLRFRLGETVGLERDTTRMTQLLKTCCTVMALLYGPAIGSADVVKDWNEIMVTTVSGQSPFAQARFAAITQLAVFEAVNAITGDFKPYLGSINAPASASAEAAAIAAANTVLKSYFPTDATSLDAARASSLAAIADGPAKSAGIAAGDAAAAALIAARANDGSGTPKFHMPSSSDPGEWQTTPSCPAGGGVFLHWPEVTPFGIKSASQFRLDPPRISQAPVTRGITTR